MKRTASALLAIGMFGLASCTDANPPVVVQGAVFPTQSATGNCLFAPGDATAFRINDEVQVAAMKQLFDGQLRRYLGLQVANNLTVTPVANPNGSVSNPATQDDVILESADVELRDATGSSLAKETVQTNAYVPTSGKGVAIIDYLAKPVADVLTARTDAFDGFLVVTFHGHTVGGAAADSQAYQYPVQFRYDSLASLTAGGDGGSGLPFGISACE